VNNIGQRPKKDENAFKKNYDEERRPGAPLLYFNGNGRGSCNTSSMGSEKKRQ
jgi:hypothetical protein